MPKVKGVILDSARAFVVESASASAWDEVLDALPQDSGRQVRSSITVGWYELGLYVRLLAAMEQVLGSSRPMLCEEYGAFAAEHDLNRLFRVLLRMANPAYVLEISGEYWGRFHDSGRFEVTRISPLRAQTRVSDWGAVDVRACRVLRAYIARMLELVGAKTVVVQHIRCRARGDAGCDFEISWR